MKFWKRVALGVGAVSAMAALGGCGSGASSTDAGGQTSDDSRNAIGSDGPGLDGPVMRHRQAFTGDGEDAEVKGVIEIEGDCLYVAFDEVGERYPVVWPATTSWDVDAGRVILPTGESVGHGDSVYGGGGYRYVDDVEAVAGDAAADLAEVCVDNQYGEIAVVNNQATGIGAADPSDNRGAASNGSADTQEPGGEWLVNDLIVDGVSVGLDESWPITVSVDGDVISGTAACNEYVGEIDWSAEGGYGRFVVSDLSWTEIACDTQAMEIEQSFLTALQVVDSYEAADGLYVGTAAGVATNFHLIPATPG